MRITILCAAVLTSALVACAAAESESSTSTSAQDTAVTTTTDAGASTDAAADADASPPVTTYDDVAPLIAAHCGTCHRTSFSTLAKVKSHKDSMIEVLEGHVMPRNDPFWSDTPDGQMLLGYLHDSTELQ